MSDSSFTTIRYRDLGAGIDSESAENNIADGYCEDITNADPKSTGQISKRKGYQGYAGYIPVRVASITYTTDATDNIILTLDTSINVPVGGSSPVILQGRTSSDNTGDVGDFPSSSDSIKYYANYNSEIRVSFDTSNTPIVVEQSAHNLTGPYFFVGVSQSTSLVKNDHEVIGTDISIDTLTDDVTVSYDNNTGSDFQGFVYLKEKSIVSGETYVTTANTINTGSSSVVITQGTHGLDTTNIIVRIYEESGTDLLEVDCDKITLDDSTGEVEVFFENNTGSSFDVTLILTSVSQANFATGSIASGTSETVTIDTSVTGGSDFAFVECYLETAPNQLERVYPDSITNDSDNNTITVNFTNNDINGANFEIYWDFATVTTNTLTLSGDVIGTGFTDSAPQLTLYGLCHEEIYKSFNEREGWTNHIDSYRATGEQRLISGLGGNLFSAQLSAEGSNSSDLLMPTLYPNINKRLLNDTVIAPVFHDDGDTPGRTRGFITGTTAGTNFVEITDINYISGTGYVDYTLSIPSMTINGTLSDIISTTSQLEDRLTVEQAGHSKHNGTFKIEAVTSGVDSLVISVSNSLVDSADYDETDVGGLAGIFTDRIVFDGDPPFINGDILDSDLFSDSTSVSVITSSTSSTLIDGITDVISMPNGLRLVGKRTSYVIPLRTEANVSSVENIVRGDMLSYTGIGRELRVKSVNQNIDFGGSIVGDGTTATFTYFSGTTDSLFIGKKLLIRDSASYDGTVTVTDLLSSSAFTFSSTAATTETGTVEGKTVEIDEELTFEDTTNNSTSTTVVARWVPIEFPQDSFNQTPETRPFYFDSNQYDNQEIIRSTMVQDSLYLTDNDNEVMKFDGTNIYRAGLFRWQPNLFVTTDTTATGKIVMDNPSVAFTTKADNRFTVASGEEQSFQVGNIIRTDTDDQDYVITSIDTAGQVVVNRTISGAASGNITRTRAFQYYFRLNAIDANSNVVASAVTGSEDFAIRLAEDASVNIRLVGVPAWDIYDYDRLEVEIYRTKADTPAPFFRLSTIALNFDTNDGYVDYVDTDSDDDLRELDGVNTALKGAELGTAWTQPLRAKYCTTAGNRLILGNVRDYPEMDVRVIKNSSILLNTTFSDIDNRSWQFRKDNTDTGTGTDMVNRALYQFVNTSQTVSSITGTLDTSFLVTTSTPHTRSIGDWVYLFHSAVTDGDELKYAGWWQVATVPSGTTFTVNFPSSESGAATSFPDSLAKSTTGEDIPVFVGTDGNYGQINGNRDSSLPFEFLAMKRLAEAINCSMRQVDININNQSAFEPWMTAAAGNEFSTGQLVIRQPRVFNTNIELVIPSLDGSFDVFVNNVKRAGDGQAGAVSRSFPSRILVSYPNYPEIFDSPTNQLDTESDSAIDINSADGQEITAIIPFFGDAAFGASQQSGSVVVFKTNSIYLVDLAAKAAGLNAVQKLETRGKGCNSPYSVSVTRNGIMFLNDTGLYRLGRDLKVEYVGRKYERKFLNNVNKNQIALATGHHDSRENSYKVSYATDSDTENSTVAVYNHTREYQSQGFGSWTTYNNHPVTGWANLGSDSYFSSTRGRVFIQRDQGDSSDYRDDDQAIDMNVLLGAMDQGETGQRKIYGKIITHYRNISATAGTELTAALNLQTVFQNTDVYKISRDEDQNGLSSTGYKKVVTISSVIDEKNGQFIQLRYTNNVIDEPVEIAGIDLRVKVKGPQGLTEAADTTG